MEEPNYIFIFNIAVLQTIVKEIEKDVVIISEARTAKSLFFFSWQAYFPAVFEYTVNYYIGRSFFYHIYQLEDCVCVCVCRFAMSTRIIRSDIFSFVRTFG